MSNVNIVEIEASLVKSAKSPGVTRAVAYLPPGLIFKLRASGEAGIAVLVKMLTGADKHQRLLAAMVLGRLNNVAAVPALLAATTDRDRQVRTTAAWSLALIDGEAAAKALQGLLDSTKDSTVRANALVGLCRMKVAGASAKAIAFLEDPRTPVEDRITLASTLITVAAENVSGVLAKAKTLLAAHAPVATLISAYEKSLAG